MNSRTAFCQRCGQRLPDEPSGSVCRSCQIQQQQQKQTIWLASGLIVLFVLVLTTFLAVQIAESSHQKAVKQQSYIERFAKRMAEKRKAEKEQEEQTERINRQIDELNAQGEEAWKRRQRQQSSLKSVDKKASEPDFGPYIAELQRRIRHNWKPPAVKENKHISVIFRIKRDGSLSGLHIHQSSGFPEADEAALDAVRTTAPFRPLPDNYRGQDIPVQFTFDYELSKPHSAAQHRSP